MMKKLLFITSLLTMFFISKAQALNYGDVQFYFDVVGTDSTQLTSYQGSAPITARFYINVTTGETYQVVGEWRKWSQGGSITAPDIVRYESETELTFESTQTDSIAFYGYLIGADGEQLPFDMGNYWCEKENTPLTIKAYESQLTFPNAFSPNGDGKNDTFKPKTAQSIIEFHATVFNRWGQKLYQWDDVKADGWDGTFHGRTVKDGVYFINVRARGADGQTFNIKKDINVLTVIPTEETTTN